MGHAHSRIWVAATRVNGDPFWVKTTVEIADALPPLGGRGVRGELTEVGLSDDSL